HLELALAHYSPEQLPAHLSLYSQDPRVVCLCRLAMNLWLLGYPRSALQSSAEALQLAQDLAHPFSLTYALGWSVMLAIEQHAPELAAERADAFLAMSREHELLPLIGQGTVLRGWARAEIDNRQAGIAEMRAGIADCRALGDVYLLPYFLCLLTEQLVKL